MRLFSNAMFIAWLGVACGCAAAPDNHPRPIAKDPVCLYNRDFACVNVRVDEETPRIVHLGKTYYFCNEECGEVFQADPEKYLAVVEVGLRAIRRPGFSSFVLAKPGRFLLRL